jgi:hypothetical protein
MVKRALETLKGRARVKRTMWSRRAQEYEAKINSGDIVAIAEVVRDLYRSEQQPEQSYSERQLYEAALDRLSREISAVQHITPRPIDQRPTGSGRWPIICSANARPAFWPGVFVGLYCSAGSCRPDRQRPRRRLRRQGRVAPAVRAPEMPIHSDRGIFAILGNYSPTEKDLLQIAIVTARRTADPRA